MDVLSGDVLGVGYAAADTTAGTTRETYMLDADRFGLSMEQEAGTFLPREAAEMPALSRLRDFLAYPDKASFFRLGDTESGFARVPEGAVELRFFLSSYGAQQLTALEDGDITTNVVPAVNLYLDQSNPVRYDYARVQVPVKPASATEMEVTSLQIRDVRKLTHDGEVTLPRITSPQRRTAGTCRSGRSDTASASSTMLGGSLASPFPPTRAAIPNPSTLSPASTAPTGERPSRPVRAPGSISRPTRWQSARFGCSTNRSRRCHRMYGPSGFGMSSR